MLFRDRIDAGQRLAARLTAYRGAAGTIVLGIPRGGIIVGQAMAEQLDLPLGVCPVRKIGAPENPELAVGAVDDQGEKVVDERLLDRLGVSPLELEAEAAYQRRTGQHQCVWRHHRAKTFRTSISPSTFPVLGTKR